MTAPLVTDSQQPRVPGNDELVVFDSPGMTISRRSLVLVLAIVLAAAGAAIVLVLVNTGGHEYDDTAHRAAVEEAIGSSFTESNWTRYVELQREFCDLDTDAFNLQLALSEDQGRASYEADLASVRHLCPDRAPDIAEYEQIPKG